jgi:hypothetical protein
MHGFTLKAANETCQDEDEALRPTCAWCGKPFFRTRAWMRFCSSEHRKAHHLANYHHAMRAWRERPKLSGSEVAEERLAAEGRSR